MQHKSQLNNIDDKLVTLNTKKDDDLPTEHAELETRHFSYSRQLKAVLKGITTDSVKSYDDGNIIRILKLDITTLDSEIL